MYFFRFLHRWYHHHFISWVVFFQSQLLRQLATLLRWAVACKGRPKASQRSKARPPGRKAAMPLYAGQATLAAGQPAAATPAQAPAGATAGKASATLPLRAASGLLPPATPAALHEGHATAPLPALATRREGFRVSGARLQRCSSASRRRRQLASAGGHASYGHGWLARAAAAAGNTATASYWHVLPLAAGCRRRLPAVGQLRHTINKRFSPAGCQPLSNINTSHHHILSLPSSSSSLYQTHTSIMPEITHTHTHFIIFTGIIMGKNNINTY